MTLLAARSGARVPEVLAADGRAVPGRRAVCTRPPTGTRLVDRLAAATPAAGSADAAAGPPPLPVPDPGVLPDAAADDLFAQVLKLRSARIAHGSVSGATVVADDRSAGLVDFRRATSTGPDERLDRDVAAALATAGLAMGAERAVAAADRVLPTDVLASALPFLQRAALDPVLSRALRGRRASWRPCAKAVPWRRGWRSRSWPSRAGSAG